MAALDFPSSPTNGQQWTAPNGVLYSYDGTAWTLVNTSINPWTIQGATITPTDPMKSVTVPGPAAGASVIVGSGTIKGRLQWTSAPFVGLSLNRDTVAGNAVDDSSKSTWLMGLNIGNDTLSIQRSAPGAGTFPNVLQLDNAGNLTLAGGTHLFGGTTNRGAINCWAGSGPNAELYANYLQAVSTRPVWKLLLASDGNDNVSFNRQAPSGGAWTQPMYVDAGGNLVIIGSIGQKASGTAWSNPSDPRLKTDVSPYARGLADIVKLDPIEYTLKSSGIHTCGFDAAKVRDIFPECVSETRMKLDPADEDETEGVLVFDMHPILVALVNAVKELAARVG